MAAISVTAASVAAGSPCTTETGVAGASITAGQPLWKDEANSNVIKLADCDLSAAAATVVGISLHAASSGQPITYATSGFVTFNAALTAGKAYVAGATAGEINPIADLTTNWRTSLLGIAYSTTSLKLLLHNSGISNA